MSRISKWLEEDNHRIVLVDIQYHDGTVLRELNLSSHPYVMRAGDKFTNSLGSVVQDIYYDDILGEIPSITTKIDASVTVGNIIASNSDGEYDWLVGGTNVFEGHKIKVYLGDPAWYRSSFILILDGVTESITAPSLDSLSISIRDRRQELDLDVQSENITSNTSVSGNIPTLVSSSTVFSGNILYENGTTYATWPQSTIVPEAVEGSNKPLLLGKCFNIEPVLVDSANHVFMLSSEPITSVSKVRSNGVELATSQYEVDTTIGCIRLLNHDRGTQITCDAIGLNTRHSAANTSYSLTTSGIASLVEWLILDKTSFTSADICYDSFTGLGNTSTVGLYIRDNITIKDAVSKFANSVGAYLRFNKITSSSTCTIQLQRLILPTDASAPSPVMEINADFMVKDGLSIINIEQPFSDLTLGYAKNWTPQDKGSLAGVITTDNNLALVDTYASEYSKVFATNNIKSQYPLAKSSELIETLLYDKIDAQAEVNRRALIRSKKRYVYEIDSIAAPFTLNIGDVITLKHVRYDFTGRTNPQDATEEVLGKDCLVIGLNEKLTEKRVVMEVWL